MNSKLRKVLMTGLAIWSGTVVYAMPVTQVSVHVDASQPIPAAIQHRMEASIRVIGERVLVGTDAGTLSAQVPAYETVIADVAGRVMSGYAVTGVTLIPDSHAQVRVAVVPYGNIVRQVKTHVDYGNLSPQAVALVKRDLGDIDAVTEDLLVGLPIDSIDWAGSVADTILTERLAHRLPEFIVQTRIQTASTTEVSVYLIPKGTMVRDAEVIVHHTDVPRLFLNGAVRRIETKLPTYVGLPADFVARHAADVTADLIMAGNQDSFVRRYGIDISGQLQTGSRMQFELTAQTTRWNIDTNVAIDIGKREDGVTLHGGIGRRIGSHDMLFVEGDFFPNSVSWDVYAGYKHRFPQQLVAGYRYEMTEKDHRVWLEKHLGSQWYIRWEHGFKGPENEYRIGYRWHDHIGMEYVLQEDDRWLRIIGYL